MFQQGSHQQSYAYADVSIYTRWHGLQQHPNALAVCWLSHSGPDFLHDPSAHSRHAQGCTDRHSTVEWPHASHTGGDSCLISMHPLPDAFLAADSYSTPAVQSNGFKRDCKTLHSWPALSEYGHPCQGCWQGSSNHAESHFRLLMDASMAPGLLQISMKAVAKGTHYTAGSQIAFTHSPHWSVSCSSAAFMSHVAWFIL